MIATMITATISSVVLATILCGIIKIMIEFKNR